MVGLRTRATQGARLLDGHAAASRPRRSAAGRPASHRPGRAGERAGSGRHPLAARAAAAPRRRGPDGPVSSHQLNEVQEIADRVVILNHGQLVRAGSIAELTEGTDSVLVRSPNMDRLRAALAGQHITVEVAAPVALRIRGLTIEQVGHLAFVAGSSCTSWTGRVRPRDLFFALTHGDHPSRRARRTGPGRPPVIRLVHAEFVKLRTTQVWFWLLLAALALQRACPSGRSHRALSKIRVISPTSSPAQLRPTCPCSSRSARCDHRVSPPDHHARGPRHAGALGSRHREDDHVSTRRRGVRRVASSSSSQSRSRGCRRRTLT